MKSSPIFVIRRTLLSRKPRAGSGSVATIGTAALFAIAGLSAGDPWALAAEPYQVFSQHQYWRLFTAMLVHRDLDHLLSNALPWWGFSFLLFGYFGTAVFPLGTLVIGTLVTAISLLTYPDGTLLLGASGVVYLMGGFWLTLYLLIDRRNTVGRRLLHALGFALALMAPQSLDPATSYRTHAVGFAAGIVCAAAYFGGNLGRIRAAEVVEMESPAEGEIIFH